MPLVSSLERLIAEYGDRGAKQLAKSVGEELSEESAERILAKAASRETDLAASEAKALTKSDEVTPQEAQRFSDFLGKPTNKVPEPTSPMKPLGDAASPFKASFGSIPNPEPKPKAAIPEGDRISAGQTLSDEDASALDNLAKRSQEEKAKRGLLARNKGKVAAGTALAATYGASRALDTEETAQGETPPPETPPGAGGSAGKGPTVPMQGSDGTWKSVPLKKPEDLDSISRHYEERIKALKGPIADKFAAKKSELDELAAELKEEYKAQKGQLAWSELAESLGHALTQLGAGIQGVQTGVDMSGLKFNKTDWAKKYDAARDDLKLELDELRGKEKALGEAEKDEGRLAEKQADFEADGRMKDRAAVQADNRQIEGFNRKTEFDVTDREDRQRHDLDLASAKTDTKGGTAEAKRAEEIQRAKAAVVTELRTIKNLDSKKQPEAVRQALRNYYSKTGQTPPSSEQMDQAMEKLLDPGFFDDPDSGALEQLLTGPEKASASTPAASSDTVKVQKGNLTYDVPADKAKTLIEQHGWQRVQ